MADTKLTALSEVSVPDFSDDMYLVDNTGPTSNKVGTDRLFGLGGFIPGGRLTLTTAVPVTTADVTAAGTLYYTPYVHNLVRLYDGTRWLYKTFSEISLSLTLTSGKNYDVFLDDDASTLVLSSAWTNDTTRNDALGNQDSVKVLNSDKTKLYLGTIRASGTNTTEDSAGGSTTQVGGKRFVWNYYNQVPRNIIVKDTADNWTYNTGTWRVSDGATGPLNCVEYVIGINQVLVNAWSISGVNCIANAARNNISGIGVDSTSTPSGFRGVGLETHGSNSNTTMLGASFSGYPGLGYHYLSWLEFGSDGTNIWLGDNANDGSQTGLFAEILA